MLVCTLLAARASGTDMHVQAPEAKGLLGAYAETGNQLDS